MSVRGVQQRAASTHAVDGLDAEGVTRFFDEEARKQVCHEVFGTNLVKRNFQSVFDIADDTVCIGSSDMTEKDIDNASCVPPAFFQGVRENTFLELAKPFIKKTEELADDKEGAGSICREEWLGPLNLDVLDMEMKMCRTSHRSKITDFFHK